MDLENPPEQQPGRISRLNTRTVANLSANVSACTAANSRDYSTTTRRPLSDAYAQVAGERDAPIIRITHWQDMEDGVACTYDSHPGNPHRAQYIIIPPSLIMPNDLPSMQGLAGWMTRRP